VPNNMLPDCLIV